MQGPSCWESFSLDLPLEKDKIKNGYMLAVSMKLFESICDQAAAMEPGTDDSRRM